MPREKASQKKARVLSSRESYRGPVFWVTTDDVLEPTGVRVRRDVVRHSGSVVILVVRAGPSGPEVLLERQYRHAAGRFLYELPPEESIPAKRNLRRRNASFLKKPAFARVDGSASCASGPAQGL